MKTVLTSIFVLAAAGTVAGAHDGRRFDVQVINNRLFAQGYLSGSTPDDGGGLIRPYYNALHGHWENNPAPGVVAASADLPGFDVLGGSRLTGESLSLTLLGASKWVNPERMPSGHVVPGTVPELVGLDAGEEVFVSYEGETLSTDTLGTLTLAETIGVNGALDIDLSYDIGAEPSNTLIVLRFELSTSALGVASSLPVHVILSPDGANGFERMHHASLYLEQYLGVVPAPGVVATMAAGGLVAAKRRRGDAVIARP